MIVGIVRIILCRITFSNDRIRCQIKEKPNILWFKIHAKHFLNSAFFHKLSNHYERSYPQTTTPWRSVFFFWKWFVRKKAQEVLIRLNHIQISFGMFPNRYSFWCSIFFLRIVGAVYFVIDIGGVALLLTHYFSWCMGHFDETIYVHFSSPFLDIILSIMIVTQNPYFCNESRRNMGIFQYFFIHFMTR